MNRDIKIVGDSITFTNRGIGFFQAGISHEILSLISDLQEENEKLSDMTLAKYQVKSWIENKSDKLEQSNSIINALENYLIYQSELDPYNTDLIGDIYFSEACKKILEKLKEFKEGKLNE